MYKCVIVFCDYVELQGIRCMQENTLCSETPSGWPQCCHWFCKQEFSWQPFPALPSTLYSTPGMSAWRKMKKKWKNEQQNLNNMDKSTVNEVAKCCSQGSFHFALRLLSTKDGWWWGSTCWEWAMMQRSPPLMHWGAQRFLLQLFPPLPSEHHRHAPGRCCKKTKKDKS